MKRKLQAPDSRPLADFLPTISIKAKDLAAEMTSVNVQTKDLRGQKPIEQEHIDNNTAEHTRGRFFRYHSTITKEPSLCYETMMCLYIAQ